MDKKYIIQMDLFGNRRLKIPVGCRHDYIEYKYKKVCSKCGFVNFVKYRCS